MVNSSGQCALSLARVAGLVALAAGLASCSGSDAPAPTPVNVESAALKQFTGDDACVQLEEKIESVAGSMMTEQLGYLKNYYPNGGRPAPVFDGAVGSGDSAQPPEAGRDSGENYSNTNVQVQGVDEFDTVKNTGEHVYTLSTSGDETLLSQIALRPANAMQLVGQTRWSAVPDPSKPYQRNRPMGMFLNGSQELISLSTGDNAFIIDIGVTNDVAATSICIEDGCGPGIPDFLPPTTVIRSFALSGSAAPAESWRVELAGRLLQARRIGNKIYLASQATMQFPDGLRWWPEIVLGGNTTQAQWNSAVDELIAKNRLLVEQAALTDWLSTLRLPGEAVTEPTPQQCSAFATPEASTRLGWLRIHTIDLDSQSVTHQTLMAEGSSLYMSTSSLLVTTNFWVPGSRDQAGPGYSATLLHRFNLSDDGSVSYDSSGSLRGRLINRFAIDQDDNSVVRLAMQDWAPESGRYSYVATMQKSGQTLAVLGQSDPIAPGETLQSARFVGDKAYLVTFLQVDPFFVYDLSNPAAPQALGELKIPGFSSYLHPVGENHVLGIGYDGGGWPRKVKASLFDVTNPLQPLQQSVLLLGDSYTDSDALWDPHAFTFYYPRTDSPDAVMAVPVRSYASSQYGTVNESGIRLLNVRPGEGADAITLQGTLDMSDLLGNRDPNQPWRSADARRAVFVGDDVYAVSDAAVRSATIADPASPLDTVSIP